ncbi:chromate transporter [Salinibacillus kushneri]|uniref:Chromate transporter n=1 Tax=Salinibacillus kushneri TaxID=237682 RepID=A0A1I0DV41_9BACI|nr:chromate transporter [Salinibacillus kushneri]SET36109.1 chromate transporter [Salinibacillus kushneri]
MTQWHLFLAFFRVGIFGYGGGPSSIPLVQKEVVEKYKWLDDEEFANILALGNSLPGPIATKMAGYIGYRVSGILGMVNAVLATIVPTIFLIIILLTFLSSFSNLAWVNGMTEAVVPVVGVMLALLTYGFIKKSHKANGWLITIGLLIASLILIEWLGVHPAILIAVILLYALFKPAKQEESDDKKGKQETANENKSAEKGQSS